MPLTPEQFAALPDEMDGAIAAIYHAIPGIEEFSTGIYRGTAYNSGTAGRFPFLTFRVDRGEEVYASDRSFWVNHRIHFDCVSDRVYQANALARVIALAFGGPDGLTGVQLAWKGGSTTPLIEVGSPANYLPVISRNIQIYQSSVLFDARARLGRPDFEE